MKNSQAGAPGYMDVRPVTLTGKVAELRPLSLEYAAGLLEAVSDPELWLYLPSKQPLSVADTEVLIRGAGNRLESAGVDLPFVIIHRESDRVAGTTRILSASEAQRSLEIGWTIVSPEFQRTAVNTECKYLLLCHAFDVMGCQRVSLQTDLRNERSQRAIERLGAQREGVLRKARIMPDGYQRSSVVYSIIDDEWPGVKANLEAKLGLVQA